MPTRLPCNPYANKYQTKVKGVSVEMQLEIYDSENLPNKNLDTSIILVILKLSI